MDCSQGLLYLLRAPPWVQPILPQHQFNGLIGVLDILFNPLAINTPEAVPIAKGVCQALKYQSSQQLKTYLQQALSLQLNLKI